MKTISWFGSVMAAGICAAGLVGFSPQRASAITISGAALSGLHYSGLPGDAQYVAGSPDVAHLQTADSSIPGDAPAAFVQASTIGASSLGTLGSFSASYTLQSSSGGNGNQPYWLTYLYAPGGGYIGVISTGGATLDGSSLIHVFYGYATSPLTANTYSGDTLAQLDATAYGSTTFGQMGIYESGVEIGDWNITGGTTADASISSITVSTSVPDSASTAGMMVVSLIGLAIVGKYKNILLTSGMA